MVNVVGHVVKEETNTKKHQGYYCGCTFIPNHNIE